MTSILSKKENVNKLKKNPTENLMKKKLLNSSYNTVDPKKLKDNANLHKNNIDSGINKDKNINNKLNSTLNDTIISKRGIINTDLSKNTAKKSLPIPLNKNNLVVRGIFFFRIISLEFFKFYKYFYE